jgi:hypothetical protein
MPDPFMMKSPPWYSWPRLGSLLLFLGIVVLLLRGSIDGPFERRFSSFVLITSLLGVAMIWFPDHFENYGGKLVGESLIDKVKPQKYEISIGWLLLLGPFVAWLITRFV